MENSRNAQLENIDWKKHYLKVLGFMGIVWIIQTILFFLVGDEQLALALNGTEHNLFTTIIELYTDLLYVMVAGTALLTLLSMFVKKLAPFRQTFLSMWLSYAITYIIIAPVKKLTAIRRPYEVLNQIDNFGHDQDDASFPSGHSGYSAATMTPLALKLQKFKKIVVWPLFNIIHVIMMYTRAYIGVHWMSDLLVGSIIGTLVALGVVIIMDKLYANNKINIKIEWILIIFCIIVSVFALI